MMCMVCSDVSPLWRVKVARILILRRGGSWLCRLACSASATHGGASGNDFLASSTAVASPQRHRGQFMELRMK